MLPEIKIDGAAPAAKRDCTPVAFATARLERRGDTVMLIVTGKVKGTGAALEVRPVTYVMQPDYWLMTLVACFDLAQPVGDAAESSYEAAINLAGSLGRKGIDLAGMDGGKPVRLEIP